MLLEGVAITVAPVVVFKPVPGDQVYVFAPPAVMLLLAPAHIVWVAVFVVTFGRALMLTAPMLE